MQLTTHRAPQVPGWPLVGHLPQMRKGGMLGLFERSWREVGDVFGLDNTVFFTGSAAANSTSL